VPPAPAHGGHEASGAYARSGMVHSAWGEHGGRRAGGSGPALAGGPEVERAAR
jgi:hypothetical protein